MDVVLMILYTVIVLGVLVVIHEAGHYLVARAFGVRVTEFMVGLPGPRIGKKIGETTFGVTAVPLGGYARICGMEPGEESPYLPQALSLVYERGTINMEDLAQYAGISNDEAYHALDELSEWGVIMPPKKQDAYNTYRTSARVIDGVSYDEGAPQPLADAKARIEEERTHQYRSLPFWKRSAILIAGPAFNVIFALIMFVIIYSVVGVDVPNQSGEMVHINLDPLRSIMAGLNYIGMVIVAVAGFFNPATAAESVANSSSVVGIAVMSKSAADAGLLTFSLFSAMLSVSLGIMNLLPIPPLDGGRFVVEVYQRLRRRSVSQLAMNRLSMAGTAFFILFFLFMVNQDIMRIITGAWI